MTAPLPEGPAAWLLTDDGTDGLVAASLARYGSIYRVALDPDGDEAPRSGDPVVLLSVDRSRVVGLWAVGQAVAEPLRRPAGSVVLPGEPDGCDGAHARTYAEVELLPVAKPIPMAELRALAALAPALSAPARCAPLSRAQRHAVEGLELWLEEPSDEQRLALDAVLAAEDEALDAEG